MYIQDLVQDVSDMFGMGTAVHLTKKQRTSVCLSVCLYAYMYVCPLHISRTVHLMYFILGECITGDPRTGSVKFGAIWTCDTFYINKQVTPLHQWGGASGP